MQCNLNHSKLISFIQRDALVHWIDIRDVRNVVQIVHVLAVVLKYIESLSYAFFGIAVHMDRLFNRHHLVLACWCFIFRLYCFLGPLTLFQKLRVTTGRSESDVNAALLPLTPKLSKFHLCYSLFAPRYLVENHAVPFLHVLAAWLALIFLFDRQTIDWKTHHSRLVTTSRCYGYDSWLLTLDLARRL